MHQTVVMDMCALKCRNLQAHLGTLHRLGHSSKLWSQYVDLLLLPGPPEPSLTDAFKAVSCKVVLSFAANSFGSISLA